MDEQDRTILNMIQDDFPLEAQPFAVIASRLGLTEDEVLARVGRMKEAGFIRRIGAVFDPVPLGYVSTLCAARVPEAAMASFVEIVNADPGVTHHYRREGDFNCWFTLICKSEQELTAVLDDMKKRTGVGEIVSFRATAVYKINARFEV